MALSETGSRKLPYPLNKTLEPIGDTPNEAVDYTTVLGFPDETTRVNITLNLSLDEYVALATAIDVGRDIAFAEDSELIWFTWVRAFSEGTVMACEDVADCVESELAAGNETLINQIFETTILNGFGNPNRVNPTGTTPLDRNPAGALGTDIIPLENCNLDALWAGIRHGIVERLDELLADTLQDMAAIPTIIGRNAAWLDIIPVLGDIAEAIVTTLSSVTPSLLSLYEAYSSEATKDELACELFQIVCAECRYPTFEEVYNHFKNYGKPETPAIGGWVLEVMTDLVTNPVGVVAKVMYFTLMCWVLGIFYIQATFNGKNGTQAIKDFALLGEDFANGNWKELCETCGELYAVVKYDYTKEQGSSYKTAGYSTTNGTYIAGKGWRVDRIDSTTGRVTMAQPIEASWVIRSVAYETSVERTVYSNYAVTARPNPNVNTGSSGLNMTLQASDNLFVRCRDDIAGFSGFQEMAISIISPNPYQEIFLKSMTIIYTEPNVPLGATPIANSSACDYYE